MSNSIDGYVVPVRPHGQYSLMHELNLLTHINELLHITFTE